YASLVLLLPHGYEGQGPEHSNARPERFLQLAAYENLRIANLTTSAQYFHLLRHQAALLERSPRPLVILTPKSLLRHPRAAARLRELIGRDIPLLYVGRPRRASTAVGSALVHAAEQAKTVADAFAGIRILQRTT